MEGWKRAGVVLVVFGSWGIAFVWFFKVVSAEHAQLHELLGPLGWGLVGWFALLYAMRRFDFD